jgi:phenylacetate-coenzyme A ligase PaaK-like adenylate-forming protein
MSKRYFEVKNYLELAEINDQSEVIIQNIQGELISRTLRNALQSVPYYKRKVKIDPNAINPSNVLQILQEFPIPV